MYKAGIVRSWYDGLVAVALLAALAVPVAGDTTGPYFGFDPYDWSDVKSPPLEESQWFGTTWAMHVTWAFSNYAGFLFDLKYDSHELSYLILGPAGPHVAIEVPDTMGLYSCWEYSGSQSFWQTVSPIAVWISPADAQESGMLVSTSALVSLFWIGGSAKNTNYHFNSDIDITISAWQILHLVPFVGPPPLYHLSSNAWVYKTAAGGWAQPGTGTWLQVPGSTSTIIVSSAFVATNFWVQNVAGYGIEHVPEPAAVLLMLVGTGAMITGRLRRRPGK